MKLLYLSAAALSVVSTLSVPQTRLETGGTTLLRRAGNLQITPERPAKLRDHALASGPGDPEHAPPKIPKNLWESVQNLGKPTYVHSNKASSLEQQIKNQDDAGEGNGELPLSSEVHVKPVDEEMLQDWQDVDLVLRGKNADAFGVKTGGRTANTALQEYIFDPARAAAEQGLEGMAALVKRSGIIPPIKLNGERYRVKKALTGNWFWPLRQQGTKLGGMRNEYELLRAETSWVRTASQEDDPPNNAKSQNGQLNLIGAPSEVKDVGALKLNQIRPEPSNADDDIVGEPALFHGQSAKRRSLSSRQVRTRDSPLSTVKNVLDASDNSGNTDVNATALAKAQAQFLAYYSAYQSLQTKAAVTVSPILKDMIAGSNSSMLISAAHSIYAEFTGDPTIIVGPFLAGKNCIQSIERRAFSDKNGTQNATALLDALLEKPVKELGLVELAVLEWFASHEVLRIKYEEAYQKSLKALTANGILSQMETLERYLQPKDTRIWPVGFNTTLVQSSENAFLAAMRGGSDNQSEGS